MTLKKDQLPRNIITARTIVRRTQPLDLFTKRWP